MVVFAAAWMVLRVEWAAYPADLGNHPWNVARLQAVDPNSFTFFVLGDNKGGTATLHELLSIAKQDRPAFGAILGDIVADPEPIRHKLFCYEIGKAELGLPLFMVPGNHDVDVNSAFTLEDFEALYGPSQFCLAIGEFLMVFLTNTPPYDTGGEYLEYFERVMSEHAGQYEHIYVFAHVPPWSFDGLARTIGSRGAPRLLELMKRYGAEYIFASDHHGYIKGHKDGTTHIITGGAGARLRGDHGRFYHMVRIEVMHADVTETVIAVQKQRETLELLERNIVTEIWPRVRGSTAGKGAVVAIVGMLIWLLVFCLKQNRTL